MAPTIVLDDGRPVLSVGSPGGSMIPTTVLQILVNHLDFGLRLPDALAAPRASQRNTAAVTAEPAFIAAPTTGHCSPAGMCSRPWPRSALRRAWRFSATGWFRRLPSPCVAGAGAQWS